MFKSLLLTTACILCVLTALISQNVFNPNDPIVNYNAGSPPATPPANTLAKWVRTQRSDIYFNTERFKAYYYNGMAFRLRYPNNYNPADPTKKYPVILFFHGIGEAGSVMDNEIQLTWGAQYFESKINEGQFDAFLLFPLTSVGDWSFSFSNVNGVLDLMQQYLNADPDRLITMGLSLGGDGTMKYTFDYPQRSAVSIASSPGSIRDFTQDPLPFVHIPFWVASGGLDNEFASPAAVQGFVDRLNNRGGDIRWTYYPQKGHGTWVEHWNEPFLLPYWLAAHKANPLVYYKQTQFPPGTPFSAKIGITGGFAEYQWQKDLLGIPATTNEITVSQPGSYRVRFRRITGGTWSDWSPNPAVITQTGSVDNIAPTVPGNLRVLSVTTNSVSLDWDNSTDNTDVAGYDIFVDGIKKYSSTRSDIIADNLTASTLFSFTVKAHDLVGNVSASSNAVSATTSAPSTGGGLNYKFYQGSFNVLPNFNALTPVKTGQSDNVNIGVRTAGVNDNYAFLWEGSITIPTAGTYTFETISDDGSKLYFNTAYSAGASALVNNDGLHAATSVTGNVTIATGTYPIAISFFEQGGGESMQVYWSGPGIARQLIPNSAFSSGTTNPPQPTAGLNYKYYEGAFNSLPNFSTLTPVKTGNSANVDITTRTPGRNDNFAYVWEGNINIPTAGSYTFETISDDGSKLYFNSLYSPGASALVNNDGLHGPVSATGTTTVPAAGTYPIAITFFELNSGETMQVYWTGPGIARQPIPNSAFVAGSTPPQPTNGLAYKYYEGSFNALPNFNALTPVKTGSSSNIDLGARTPGVNDNYAFVWEGNITITTPGNYTFETISDDGSKLYFNSLYAPGATALVNNDGLHAATSVSGSVNIPSAGSFPIAITFFEQGGGETMEVYWSGPGISRQLIPSTAFTGNSNPPPPSTAGLNYKYYEGSYSALPNFNSLSTVKTGTTANVDLAARNPGVNDNYAFVWEGYINISTPGPYTFETISDDGSKLYFNSLYAPGASALVNNDGLHAATSVTGNVNIPAAGIYPITITFFEQGGGETMEVYWTGPGIARQRIPNSAFTTTNAATGIATMSQPASNLLRGGEAVSRKTQLYPNPFRDNFVISFYNSSATNKVSAEIFDVSGRLLHRQYFGNLGAGEMLLKVSAGDKVAMPGIYFVRLNVNGVAGSLIKMMKK